ncbi:MAG: preprotein translocase subunit SecG [Candidatus Yanofskybacteria bacterium]|nr:preprotein translocase subunit SecG [Candidatus Yanofskybacteria bacterium]
MNNILTYVQVGSAVLLIITILLQQRGQGLGAGIGGGAMEYSTKRGIEKGVFYATIVLAILFIGVSVARLILGA